MPIIIGFIIFFKGFEEIETYSFFQAHNPKVVGSNPSPATKKYRGAVLGAAPFCCAPGMALLRFMITGLSDLDVKVLYRQGEQVKQ